jgi:chromosome segregation ATPase
MKYLQSFYTYPVTFASIGKGIPAADADGDLKNIAELSEKEIETLERCEPLYRELIAQKKYRVLNKLPESYKPAATQINEAREEADTAKAEAAQAKAELEALKAQVESQKAGSETKTPAKKSGSSKKSTSKTTE